MRLENWSVVVQPTANPYMAPEQLKSCLHGKIYGHSRFEDGSNVTTSEIIGINKDKIETYSGSIYELGKVDPLYEKKYPDAKNRLIASLTNK